MKSTEESHHRKFQIRDQTKNSGKALLGFVLLLRGGKTGNSYLCWLPEEETAGSLCGEGAGLCPGVGLEGSLSRSAQPLGGAVHRAHASALLPLSFWSFCISSLIMCPNCVGTQLVLVPFSFLVFCC